MIVHSDIHAYSDYNIRGSVILECRCLYRKSEEKASLSETVIEESILYYVYFDTIL